MPKNDAFIYFELPSYIRKAFSADNRAEYGDSEPPHVSVVYLPDLSDAELSAATRAVALIAKTIKPLAAEFGGLGSFISAEGITSWHVEVHCEAIHRLRETIVELFGKLNIPVNDPYTNYIPHATLAYGKGGDVYMGNMPTGRTLLSKLKIVARKSEAE